MTEHKFTEQNRADLLKLADIMARVQKRRKKFNMSSFAAVNHCGTSACAAGYAALDPEFQARGLKLTAIVWLPFKDNIVVTNASKLRKQTGKYFEIKFEGLEDFEAAAKFFGVTELASLYLFNPPDYDDVLDTYENHDDIEPRDVIRHIHAVINLNGRAPSEVDFDEAK
jgi:hypothetical protein